MMIQLGGFLFVIVIVLSGRGFQVFAAEPNFIFRIEALDDDKTVRAAGAGPTPDVGQILAIKSQTSQESIIGYVRVTSVSKFGSTNKIKTEIVRVSQHSLVRTGDLLIDLDLSSASTVYRGTTDLLVREKRPNISSRFKPLFTQGIAIGETAQALWKNEFLMTWYGQVYYGLSDWLSVGTLVLANVFKAPNANIKIQFIDSTSNSVATGLSVAKVPENNNRWLVNWNLMWDSFSMEKSVSHTFITLAIYSIEKAEDTTAIKSAGTSSFQTGYEYILDGWSRVLFGPNYNFETKAVGAYLAYLKVWDHFHLQGTLYSTNVRNPKWSVQDGYFAYFDAYWRF